MMMKHKGARRPMLHPRVSITEVQRGSEIVWESIQQTWPPVASMALSNNVTLLIKLYYDVGAISLDYITF